LAQRKFGVDSNDVRELRSNGLSFEILKIINDTWVKTIFFRREGKDEPAKFYKHQTDGEKVCDQLTMKPLPIPET
jgi:hypothetical protein